ncbi:unnamed protein product [Chrysodeixis includens]|uniref:Uncharacterized protein n=1 Tax=Chrysodeixis includens TaxID=689277 RepID=A0A9N8KW48_CHRIL|nr:unnamed protein product [Chrysodeixis includens]
MTSKISCFILFGILSIIKGKPGYDSSIGDSELQRLLRDLSKQQGKYDIAISHHEDGPKSHHEDKARISLHDDRYGARSHYHSASHERQESHDDHPRLNNIQNLNLFYRKKPSTESRNGDIDNILENLRTSNCGNCKVREWKTSAKGRTLEPNRIEHENVDEVLEFLKELDENLENGYNGRSDNRYERNHLRCRGNKCTITKANINDRNDDDRDNLRCPGDKCTLNTDDSGEVIIPLVDTNNLRCIGDTCTRDKDDRNDDDEDDRKNLRCPGNRCTKNRGDRNDDDDDDDRADKNYIRCIGDVCTKNRNDDADRDDREDARCNVGRCGKNRPDNREDREPLRCKNDQCGVNRDDNDRTDLRCPGDVCGVKRGDRLDNDRKDGDNVCADERCGKNRDDADGNDRDNLRCGGKKCTRSRNYDDDEDSNRAYRSQGRPKQYKLSDDLKAVVLDVSDLDHLLANLNIRKNNLRGAKLLENVDLENLLSYTNGNDKRANVQAVVFDLDKENDRDSLSKQIKRLLTQGNASSK